MDSICPYSTTIETVLALKVCIKENACFTAITNSTVISLVEEKYAATYVSFEALIRTSDVIFVSVPLSSSTYHLLDTPQFAMMKPGVIIVNTARGKVISESALVTALESGRVAAAGLDVFEDVRTDKHLYDDC